MRMTQQIHCFLTACHMSLELFETTEVAFLYDMAIRSQFCTVLPGMVEKVKSKKLYNHKIPLPVMVTAT